MSDADQGEALMDLFRAMPIGNRRRLLRRHGEDRLLSLFAGQASLRPAQRPPAGDWSSWVVLAGRILPTFRLARPS